MRIALALICALGFASTAFAAAEIGKPAPDFTGTDITGKTIKLGDYKGKLVVLEAFNLDCPFCANHVKTGAMQELQKEVTDRGGVWLILNSVNPKNSSHRTPEQARAEWEEHKIQATAWIDDSSGVIGRAYGLKTTPDMVVIDPAGNVVYLGAIDDRPRPNGDPRRARNYVREAIQKTLAGKKVEVSETKPYGCSIKYGG